MLLSWCATLPQAQRDGVKWNWCFIYTYIHSLRIIFHIFSVPVLWVQPTTWGQVWDFLWNHAGTQNHELKWAFLCIIISSILFWYWKADGHSILPLVYTLRGLEGGVMNYIHLYPGTERDKHVQHAWGSSPVTSFPLEGSRDWIFLFHSHQPSLSVSDNGFLLFLPGLLLRLIV